MYPTEIVNDFGVQLFVYDAFYRPSTELFHRNCQTGDNQNEKRGRIVEPENCRTCFNFFPLKNNLRFFMRFLLVTLKNN